MVKFYLDKKEGRESPIFLSLFHHGRRIKVYTGKKIEALQWNPDACRANPRKYKNNCVGFNIYLDGIANAVTSLVNENKPISKGDVAEIVNKALGKKTEDTFFGFSEGYIQQQIAKGQMKPISAKAYRVTLNHLKRTNPKLDFKDVDMNFYDKFLAYLQGEDLSANSIGGHVKRLKWFMAAAHDRDLHANVNFKKKAFKATREESDQIYLTRQEIKQLLKKSLPERLRKVADAFVLNCHMGIRYSDLWQITKENFKHEKGVNYLEMVQGKTNEKVTIPVPDEALPLLNKYKYTCPVLGRANKLMSMQKFNKYLKEAAELSGLNALETIRQKGEAKRLPKFALIKSHTARRSFATNLLLEEVPIQNIMAVTGHRKEETFLLYVRADQFTKSKGLARHYQQKQRPSMKLFKGGGTA